MFVTVKYADNREEIFNSNCKNCVLLGHIRAKCGLHPGDNIDLSDEDGSVKQLHYNLDDYATDYLRDRECLILLRVNRSGSEEELSLMTDDDVTYTPLLESLTENVEFLGSLNPKVSKKDKRRGGTSRPKKSGTSPNPTNQGKRDKVRSK